MCHPWPISRVMSRAQNFALKSQISLPNKSLRTLWTFFPLRPIMGHEICWKKILAENWDPVTPNRLQFFLRTLVFSSAELSIQAYGSAELIFWFCVVDFCWFNGFSLGFLLKKKHFRRNSTSQNVRLSSADLGFFSAEIHKSGDALLPMIPCCMFVSQCEI